MMIEAIPHKRVNGKNRNLSTTTHNNLKRNRMEPFAFSQKLLDLLSKHLPDIEHLICAGFGSAATVLWEANEKKKKITIAFDMTRLVSLKAFHYDITALVNNINEFDCIFICFKYIDSNEEKEEIYYEYEKNEFETEEEEDCSSLLLLKS
jgi:hypothetical protein